MAAGLVLLLAGACQQVSPAPVAFEDRRTTAGVELHVVVRHPDEAPARIALDEAFEAAAAVGGLLRAGRAGSEIDLLGKVPSHLWIEISEPTYAAIALGARIAEETDGAYDYTWPALLKLWRRTDSPREFELERVLRRVDWEDVEIRDDGGLQARRLNRRTEIDLGGLARGAMVDAAAERLRELGIAAARVSTITEHRFYGGDAPHPWRVAAPGTPALSAREGAVAWVLQGESARYDPRDGLPVRETRWTSARAESAAASAAYAEALFAMGAEAGDWARDHPELGCRFELAGR